jgi:hypothetical protein
MVTPRLKPLATRLLTSLVERQDRCFPHLLKAIEDDALSPEILLAKAAAVKEICRIRFDLSCCCCFVVVVVVVLLLWVVFFFQSCVHLVSLS